MKMIFVKYFPKLKLKTYLKNFKHLEYSQKCSYSNINLKPPWKILFFGSDEFSLFSLKALLKEYRKGDIIQNLDVCTSLKTHKNPVHLFAEKENLELHSWPVENSMNDFHVGLVVSFGHLIPQKIIKQFPLGMINVHASLLPRWRGAAPIIYSLANGDSITGVSIMKIKPQKFDTGEVISQKKMKIFDNMYMPELYSELGKLGAEELVQCLENLPENLVKAIPQPEENVTYAPKVDQTFPTIRWKEMTSFQIYNLERAVRGFLPVISTWQGEVIKLYDIKKLDENVCNEKFNEGFIIYDNNLDVLKVVCSDRKFISIGKLQVFKKKEMGARDFNNGYLSKVIEEKRYFI